MYDGRRPVAVRVANHGISPKDTSSDIDIGECEVCLVVDPSNHQILIL